MHVLFGKNQPLPDYKTRTLTTSKENQRSIMLKIYQGESKYVAENELLGTFVFLLSVAGIYHVTGTLDMGQIAERMAVVDATTGILIAVGFFVAFSVKLGLFPFHFWLPTVYAGARPAVAAILSGGLANIGVYGLLRFGAGRSARSIGSLLPFTGGGAGIPLGGVAGLVGGFGGAAGIDTLFCAGTGGFAGGGGAGFAGSGTFALQLEQDTNLAPTGTSA